MKGYNSETALPNKTICYSQNQTIQTTRSLMPLHYYITCIHFIVYLKPIFGKYFFICVLLFGARQCCNSQFRCVRTLTPFVAIGALLLVQICCRYSGRNDVIPEAWFLDQRVKTDYSGSVGCLFAEVIRLVTSNSVQCQWMQCKSILCRTISGSIFLVNIGLAFFVLRIY